MPVEVGQQAPDFTLRDQDRNEVKLSSFRGRRNVVVVFYPMSFTRTCEGEMCSLRDELADFEGLDAQVLAVSVDSSPVHKRWADEQGLTFPLLADYVAPGDAAQLAARSASLGATGHWLAGGTQAVPDADVAGVAVDRLAGGDRYATAALVAARGFHFGLGGRPVVASGDTFADGLSGGVLGGLARRGPLLLTGARQLGDQAALFLGARGLGEVTLMGGEAATGLLAPCQLGAGGTRPWRCAEEELARQGYNVGAVDGRSDVQSTFAIFAFSKVAGMGVDTTFGEAEWQRMLDVPRLSPRRPDLGPDHMEIDIARQLVLVVRDGAVRHAFHTSTGKPSTPTVRGVFSVYEKRNYRQANHMYRPVFFHRGYAFHGYPEVPTHPASHGCARMYDGDMDALYPMLSHGERVASY